MGALHSTSSVTITGDVGVANFAITLELASQGLGRGAVFSELDFRIYITFDSPIGEVVDLERDHSIDIGRTT